MLLPLLSFYLLCSQGVISIWFMLLESLWPIKLQHSSAVHSFSSFWPILQRPNEHSQSFHELYDKFQLNVDSIIICNTNLDFFLFFNLQIQVEWFHKIGKRKFISECDKIKLLVWFHDFDEINWKGAAALNAIKTDGTSNIAHFRNNSINCLLEHD